MDHSILAKRHCLALVLIVLAGGASYGSPQIQPPKVLDQPATVIGPLPLGGVVVSGIRLRQRDSKKYLSLETSDKPGLWW